MAEVMLCTEEDPELWFSTRPDEVAMAKAICQRCPSQMDCITVALERDERYGIWGSVNRTEGERYAS